MTSVLAHQASARQMASTYYAEAVAKFGMKLEANTRAVPLIEFALISRVQGFTRLIHQLDALALYCSHIRSPASPKCAPRGQSSRA